MRSLVRLQLAGLIPSLFIAGDLRAEAQDPYPTSAPGINLPHPDILHLFGDASPSSEAAAERVAREQGQLIRRPEAAGAELAAPGRQAALAARDQRVVKRRTGAGTTWSFWDLAPMLAIVGLILVAALMVKRFLPGRRLFTGSGVLEIVARTPISNKQNLVLVKMGRRLVLLGVSPEQISTLCIVDDPQQVAMLLGEIVSGRPGSMAGAFADSFDEQAGAYQSEPAEHDPAAVASSHVRGLLEKVRRLKKNRHVA